MGGSRGGGVEALDLEDRLTWKRLTAWLYMSRATHTRSHYESYGHPTGSDAIVESIEFVEISSDMAAHRLQHCTWVLNRCLKRSMLQKCHFRT